MLNRAIAYGAGRYGHVLFPENATEVSLELARRLLEGVGQGWASRVFYSDNGSTAVEVAIKMALRKYMDDHGLMALADAQLDSLEFGIMGLAGSYHGDTLAAMDVQVPSLAPSLAAGCPPWCMGAMLTRTAHDALWRKQRRRRQSSQAPSRCHGTGRADTGCRRPPCSSTRVPGHSTCRSRSKVRRERERERTLDVPQSLKGEEREREREGTRRAAVAQR